MAQAQAQALGSLKDSVEYEAISIQTLELSETQFISLSVKEIPKDLLTDTGLKHYIKEAIAPQIGSNSVVRCTVVAVMPPAVKSPTGAKVSITYCYTVRRPDGSTYSVNATVNGCIMSCDDSETKFTFLNVIVLYSLSLDALLTMLTEYPATVVCMAAGDPDVSKTWTIPELRNAKADFACEFNKKIEAVKKLIADLGYLDLEPDAALESKLALLQRAKRAYQFVGRTPECDVLLAEADKIEWAGLPEHLTEVYAAVERLRNTMNDAAASQDLELLCECSQLLRTYQYKGCHPRPPFEDHIKELLAKINRICK